MKSAFFPARDNIPMEFESASQGMYEQTKDAGIHIRTLQAESVVQMLLCSWSACQYQLHVVAKTQTFSANNRMTFFNCVRSLLSAVMTTPQSLTIDIMPPNPLHMKLRNVNKLGAEMAKVSPHIAAGFGKDCCRQRTISPTI